MPPDPCRRLPLLHAPAARRGAILIIVAGLASILLVLAVSFMARMRSDSQETRMVIDEAQARLMMHAALMYLQETSRLGWGDEAFGWTDVRDGGLGPRGPRPAGASGSGTAVPAPAWWTAHAGWPVFKWNAEDADLPAPAQRRFGWPCPGTATRCPMARCEIPPYAVQLRQAYNPVPTPVPYTDAAWGTRWEPNPANNDIRIQWPTTWIPAIFSEERGAKGMLDPQPVADTWAACRTGSSLPAGGGEWTHEAFDAGGAPISGATQQLAVVPGSDNLSWFRIYRETQADHDSIDNVGKPGTLWWDRVALYDPAAPVDPGTPKLRNWNTFIVACGAGGTRGYRFWDQAEIDAWESRHGLPSGYGRAIEPVTAEESGLFPDGDTFHSLLDGSRILWFRCEWSALQAGARAADIYNASLWRVGSKPWHHDGIIRYEPDKPASHATFWSDWWTQVNEYNAQYAKTEASQTSSTELSDTRSNSPKVYGGNFRWLQRLDRDPILW